MRRIERAFVTGASGFIGRHLVGSLVRQGMEVRCLVRRVREFASVFQEDVHVIEGSLADDTALRRGCDGVDVVFNLAGVVAATSVDAYNDTNVAGAWNAANAAARSPSSPYFVHVSSQAAGGPRAARVVAREDDPAEPVSDYGRSKLAGEHRVLEAIGERSVIVRPTVVYGPGDEEMLPLFRTAAWGLLPILNARATYSWTYVDDVVSGIEAAARLGRPGTIYHLASPEIVDENVIRAAMEEAFERTMHAFRTGLALVSSRAELSTGYRGLTGFLKYLFGKRSELLHLSLKDANTYVAVTSIYVHTRRTEKRFVPLDTIKPLHPMERCAAVKMVENRSERLERHKERLIGTGRLDCATQDELMPSVTPINVIVDSDDDKLIAFEGNGRLEAINRVFHASMNLLVEVMVYHPSNLEICLRRLRAIRASYGFPS